MTPTENKNQAVCVTIRDKEYFIHGRGDAEFIRSVAEYVDNRIIEIGDEIAASDTGNQNSDFSDVALLTALNIAHELLILREDIKNNNKGDDQQTEKIENLIQTIQELIDDEEYR